MRCGRGEKQDSSWQSVFVNGAKHIDNVKRLASYSTFSRGKIPLRLIAQKNHQALCKDFVKIAKTLERDHRCTFVFTE